MLIVLYKPYKPDLTHHCLLLWSEPSIHILIIVNMSALCHWFIIDICSPIDSFRVLQTVNLEFEFNKIHVQRTQSLSNAYL